MPPKGFANDTATPLCPIDVSKCIQSSDYIMSFSSAILKKNHYQLPLLGKKCSKDISGALGRVDASHRPGKLVLGLGWILMTVHSFHHKR